MNVQQTFGAFRAPAGGHLDGGLRADAEIIHGDVMAGRNLALADAAGPALEPVVIGSQHQTVADKTDAQCRHANPPLDVMMTI